MRQIVVLPARPLGGTTTGVCGATIAGAASSAQDDSRFDCVHNCVHGARLPVNKYIYNHMLSV